MPFLGIGTKVRKDPLGPSTMAALKNNADILRRLSLVEHIRSSGEHNAREIARVVRRISGTTVSPSSSDITSVTNPSAGKYVLTLAGGRFDSSFITCQVDPCGSDVANKPYLSGYKVVSSTSIEVYISQLTSALGYDPAGNVWASTNCDFDIAIHSTPLAAGSYSTGLPSNSLVGDPLKPTRWNALVQNAADIEKVLDAEHDASTGEHTTRQISSFSGMWRYNGSTVSLAAGVASGISVSRSSTGIYAVTSAAALSTQTHCFVTPDFARLNSGSPDTMFKAHCYQSSTTAFTVYVYSFNRGNSTWARADADFWLAMHKG